MLRFAPASFCVSFLAVAGLTVLSVESAQASSVTAYASCWVSNIANSQQTSTTPGVAATATYPTAQECTSTGTADYGILKLGTSVSDVSVQGNVSTQYVINFTLSDPTRPPDSPITLQIPIPYHVDISVTPGGIGSVSNSADFAIYLVGNVDPFWLYKVSTSTDSYGNGNICPSPGQTYPRCNGHYEGTVTAQLDTFINTTAMQRLWITANGGVDINTPGSAVMDALNTVTLGDVILPAGVSYTYDISGNPMHFTYAGPTAVPEPSTWWLMTGGLGILLAVRRHVGA